MSHRSIVYALGALALLAVGGAGLMAFRPDQDEDNAGPKGRDGVIFADPVYVDADESDFRLEDGGSCGDL